MNFDLPSAVLSLITKTSAGVLRRIGRKLVKMLPSKWRRGRDFAYEIVTTRDTIEEHRGSIEAGLGQLADGPQWDANAQSDVIQRLKAELRTKLGVTSDLVPPVCN